MNQIVLGSLLAALVLYGVLRGGEWLFQDMRKRKMVRVIQWDPDTALFDIGFFSRENGEVMLGGKRVSLDATARAPCAVPTYLVNPRHGYNYVPLSDAETVNKDKVLQKLAISNPAMMHNQLVRNKAKDALTANDPEDKSWIGIAIAMGAVVLLGVLGTVVWIAYQIKTSSG